MILALVVLSVIVLFHEFGHFLLAKRGGIGVTEFSLGMGPRLFSKQIGETRYSVSSAIFFWPGSMGSLWWSFPWDLVPGSFPM